MIVAKIISGTITNLLEIAPGHESAFPDCVPIRDYPVKIGDEYSGGKFFRNGEEVKNAAGRLSDMLLTLMGGDVTTSNEVWLMRLIRAALDAYLPTLADSPAQINENAPLLRPWKPGAYITGDLRCEYDIPYKCIQAHDSTSNPNWNPSASPALWMQYHGTSEASAHPWVVPNGAHDQYKAGEYMIWTDGKTYRALADTVFSPADYPQAWDAVSS